MNHNMLDAALFEIHTPLNQAIMCGTEIQGRALELAELAEHRLNDLQNDLAAEQPPPFDRERARAACLDAFCKTFTPEKLGKVIAGLPVYAQRQLVGKFLVEPPVRHRITINKKGKLASPKQPRNP